MSSEILNYKERIQKPDKTLEKPWGLFYFYVIMTLPVFFSTVHAGQASCTLDGICMLPYSFSQGPGISKAKMLSSSHRAFSSLKFRRIQKLLVDAVNGQHSFPSAVMKYANSNETSKSSAKSADKYIPDILNDSSDEDMDGEDDYETSKQDLFSGFQDSTNNHPSKFRPLRKSASSPSSSPSISTLNEIVALFMKAKSQPKGEAQVKPKEDSIQETGHAAKGAANSVLEVLQRFSNQMPQSSKRHGNSYSKVYIRQRSDKANHAERTEQISSLTKDQVDGINDINHVVNSAPVSETIESGMEEHIDNVVHHVLSDEPNDDFESENASYNSLDKSTEVYANVNEGMSDEFASSPIEMNTFGAPSEVSISTNDTMSGQSNSSSAVEDIDLSSLKLLEMRALAKSRGFKGYSRLSKAELLELLRGSKDN